MNLLYVGTEIPKQGYGAWVVIYRHLARLSEWNVSVIHTTPLPTLDAAQARWSFVARPTAPSYPPTLNRFPRLYLLRARYFANLYARRLAARPNAILNLFGVNSLEAYFLSRQLQVPLSLLVQDRWQVWTKPLVERDLFRRGWAKRVLEQATRIWTVTKELGEVYGLQNDSRVRVLLPIPESRHDAFAEWRDEFRAPTIAFAGFVHDHHIPQFALLARALQTVGGRLLLLTDRTARIREHIGALNNVDYHEPFAQNARAVQFLRERASALFVPWSFGAELERRYWDKTNFPSKLMEYAQLGLPILVLAPPHVALSNWAQARNWLGYVEEPTLTQLDSFVAQLVSRAAWEQMAEQTRHAARTEFDAAHLHAQFERELGSTGTYGQFGAIAKS